MHWDTLTALNNRTTFLPEVTLSKKFSIPRAMNESLSALKAVPIYYTIISIICSNKTPTGNGASLVEMPTCYSVAQSHARVPRQVNLPYLCPYIEPHNASGVSPLDGGFRLQVYVLRSIPVRWRCATSPEESIHCSTLPCQSTIPYAFVEKLHNS